MVTDVAAANDMIRTLIPALANLGIELVDLGDGYARSRLPFEGNGNHFGTMYAGSLFCAGECLAGVLCATSFDLQTYYPLVKNLKINYRRPAKSDVTATACLDISRVAEMKAELESSGKAAWELNVELTDTSGEVVATMTGECQLRKWT